MAISMGVGEPRLITRLTMSLGSKEKLTPGNFCAKTWRSFSLRSSTRIRVAECNCT